MTYRLIAFDYDGTAARDGNLPTERVRAAIAAARGRGAVTVLATGRPYDSARGYAEALGVDTPVICFQGAMVRELVGDRRVLFVEPAPADAMAEILRLADLYVTDIEETDLIEWEGGGPDDWPGLSEHHEP